MAVVCPAVLVSTVVVPIGAVVVFPGGRVGVVGGAVVGVGRGSYNCCRKKWRVEELKQLCKFNTLYYVIPLRLEQHSEVYRIH